MTKQVIVGPDGVSTEIDTELFREKKELAFEYLGEIDSNKEALKGVVEELAEGTGLTKGFINKYLKARYKTETEAAKLLGDSFASLDAAV